MSETRVPELIRRRVVESWLVFLGDVPHNARLTSVSSVEDVDPVDVKWRWNLWANTQPSICSVDPRERALREKKP